MVCTVCKTSNSVLSHTHGRIWGHNWVVLGVVEWLRACKREFQDCRSPEVVVPWHYDRNPQGSNLFGTDPTGKAALHQHNNL